jgi:hypothetical protein
VAQRRAQALRLRQEGHGFDAIALRLGYRSRSGAWKACAAGLRAVVVEGAETLRTLELSRLDELWQVLWPRALSGDLSAVDRCLVIQKRRASLLGLDAPRRIAATVAAEQDELRQAVAVAARLAGLDPGAVEIEAMAIWEQMRREGGMQA